MDKPNPNSSPLGQEHLAAQHDAHAPRLNAAPIFPLNAAHLLTLDYKEQIQILATELPVILSNGPKIPISPVYMALNLIAHTGTIEHRFKLQEQNKNLILLILELYYQITVELDLKFEQALRRTKNYLEPILMIDPHNGYNMIKRYFYYYDNFINQNDHIKTVRNKVLFSRGFSIVMIILLYAYLLYTGHDHSLFGYLIKAGILILICIFFYIYTNPTIFDYWLRFWILQVQCTPQALSKIQGMHEQIYLLDQEIKVAQNDLGLMLKKIIAEISANNLIINTSTITFDQLKHILLSHDITEEQRIRLFTLIDFQSIMPFTNDYYFIFLSIRHKAQNILWLIMTVLLSIYSTYLGTGLLNYVLKVGLLTGIDLNLVKNLLFGLF